MKSSFARAFLLALPLALFSGLACSGDDSSGSESDTTASSGTSTAGDEAEVAAICEALCAEPAPATPCGDAPGECISACSALGTSACLTCRKDESDLGWAGMMACGFTPCSFTDAEGYDACAANCDPESATCEFLLGDEVAEACAEACSG